MDLIQIIIYFSVYCQHIVFGITFCLYGLEKFPFVLFLLYYELVAKGSQYTSKGLPLLDFINCFSLKKIE